MAISLNLLSEAIIVSAIQIDSIILDSSTTTKIETTSALTEQEIEALR